jgi:phosphocarrier protein
MTEIAYTIRDEAGIHARPAGLIVKKAQQYASDVTVTKGDKTASLKKLFALMGLAVKQNETVVIRAEGPDEAEAIAGVKAAMEEEGL